MSQSLSLVALLVHDYDEAIQFYVEKLGFQLIEDTYQPEQDKRWVVVQPGQGGSASILLAKASDAHQTQFVGNQSGGRVFLFLQTDDFDADYADYADYKAYIKNGVEFVREPKIEPYGKVAVFSDLYGNLWDLIEYK